MTSREGFLEPKQRRSQETLERIVDAAEALLLEHGDEFTMLDVCSASGVSTSSLYLRFKSRDDLLLALYERIIQRGLEISDEVATHLRSTPMTLPAAIEYVARAYLDYLLVHQRSVSAIHRIHNAIPAAQSEWNRTQAAIIDMATEVFAAGDHPELADLSDAELRNRVEGGYLLLVSTLQRSFVAPFNFAEARSMSAESVVELVVPAMLGQLARTDDARGRG